MAYEYIETRALELMGAFARYAKGKPATPADTLELMLDVGLAFKKDHEGQMIHALATHVASNPELILPGGRMVEYLADELDVSLSSSFKAIGQRVPGASACMLVDLSEVSAAKLRQLREFADHHTQTSSYNGLSVWGRYLSGLSSYLNNEAPADHSCDFLERGGEARKGPQRHLFVKGADVMMCRRGIRGFNF